MSKASRANCGGWMSLRLMDGLDVAACVWLALISANPEQVPSTCSCKDYASRDSIN